MGRKPKHDDTEILNRAMTVFWRDGWSHTSIRDLEAALDMKAPSIYRRFGTKEGLGVAVVEHYVERVVRRRVARHLPGDGDPVDNIQRFLERSVAQPDPDDRLLGCLLTTTALDLGPTGATRLEAAVRSGLAVIEEGIAREVRRADDHGRLGPGIDPAAATTTLSLVMQGLMAAARSGASSAELTANARAAVSVVCAEHRP